MKSFEVSGFYGSQNTPCTVFCAETNGGTWYCCEDSHNVNFTYDEVNDGVNVEELKDSDYFNWPHKIKSLEELETAIES